MKREGKTDAIKAWVKSWPYLDDLIKLNAILSREDDASLNPVGTDSAGKPFIDGSAVHEYVFQLKLVLPWSDGYDDVNTEAQKLMESWMDWVDEQFPNNVPEWDAEIEAIEAVSTEPDIMVYQEDSVAEYNFIGKIIYSE